MSTSLVSNLRVLAGLTIVVSLVSCTTLPEAEPSAESTRELKIRVLELQRKAAIAEVELARLREQVARLEMSESGPAHTAATDRADGLQAQAPASSSTGRPGSIPTSGGQVTSAGSLDQSRGNDGLESQDPRPQRVESRDLPPVRTQPVYTQPAPRVRTEVEEFPEPPVRQTFEPQANSGGNSRQPVSSEAQTLYDKGYTLFHQSRYVDAESIFQQFLQAHGNTDLADNAQFWIGESRFSRREWTSALAAYRETIERYPSGNKAPDAMLKIGETLKELGDLEGARITYDEVVEQFPFSAAATTALEHLAEN